MTQVPEVSSAPVVLVKGGDEALVRDMVVGVEHALLGDLDRELVVEDLMVDPSATDDAQGVDRVVMAVQTPSFLVDRRIVIARGVGVLTTKEAVAGLVAYLADPMPSAALVLVWDKAPDSKLKQGPPPKSLVAAIAACGGVVVDTDPGKKAEPWIDEQLAGEQFRLDKAARSALIEHLGDEPQRLLGILATLRGVYVAGSKLGPDDLVPYLGAEGDVTPWALTDAIAAGDVGTAVAMVQRMLANGRHPIQVLATLSSWVGNLLALDGAAVVSKEDAARLIGGHPFVAGKAAALARQAGPERIAEAVTLVADADLDVRGRSALPPVAVLEVLVARLATRIGSGRSGSRRPAGASRSR